MAGGKWLPSSWQEAIKQVTWNAMSHQHPDLTSCSGLSGHVLISLTSIGACSHSANTHTHTHTALVCATVTRPSCHTHVGRGPWACHYCDDQYCLSGSWLLTWPEWWCIMGIAGWSGHPVSQHVDHGSNSMHHAGTGVLLTMQGCTVIEPPEML